MDVEKVLKEKNRVTFARSLIIDSNRYGNDIGQIKVQLFHNIVLMHQLLCIRTFDQFVRIFEANFELKSQT